MPPILVFFLNISLALEKTSNSCDFVFCCSNHLQLTEAPTPSLTKVHLPIYHLGFTSLQHLPCRKWQPFYSSSCSCSFFSYLVEFTVIQNDLIANLAEFLGPDEIMVSYSSTIFHVKIFAWLQVFNSSGYFYLGVEWLGHMITWWLVFRKVARLFSKAAAPFYIPASCVCGF